MKQNMQPPLELDCPIKSFSSPNMLNYAKWPQPRKNMLDATAEKRVHHVIMLLASRQGLVRWLPVWRYQPVVAAVCPIS
jgi:hypothetical protein